MVEYIADQPSVHDMQLLFAKKRLYELQEAVRKERGAFVAWAEKGGASYPDWAEGRDAYDAARAAVDALIGDQS